MNAIVDEPKNLSTDKEIKWSAAAKIYIGDKVVGIGYALCSNKEARKRSFDEYAILSMAQTRAIGKAYRNKIGWIMKLAGYESTPSEEMTKIGETPNKQSASKYQQPAKQPSPSQTPAVDYSKKLADELRKRGAHSITEAIAIYNRITGENIKSLRISQATAKKILFNLLNSPSGKK